jgi:hypothetical protein
MKKYSKTRAQDPDDIGPHPDLRRAAKAVCDLAAEQGSVGARDAHDAWRWPLVSLGWKQGPELDREAKLHPNLCAFDALPEEQQPHALLYLAMAEAFNAEQDSDHGKISEPIEVKG